MLDLAEVADVLMSWKCSVPVTAWRMLAGWPAAADATPAPVIIVTVAAAPMSAAMVLRIVVCLPEGGCLSS